MRVCVLLTIQYAKTKNMQRQLHSYGKEKIYIIIRQLYNEKFLLVIQEETNP